MIYLRALFLGAIVLEFFRPGLGLVLGAGLMALLCVRLARVVGQ
jgi:hypothetical protein